jgi:serine/threonine-protein kinase
MLPAPDGSSNSAVILRPETRESRPILVPLVLVALVLVGASSLITAVMLRKSQPAAEATTTAVEPPPPEASVPQKTPSAPMSTVAEAAKTARPVAPSPPTVRKDAPVQPKKPIVAAPPDTASAKRAHCNPPFTVDEQGVRVLKRECL